MNARPVAVLLTAATLACSQAEATPESPGTSTADAAFASLSADLEVVEQKLVGLAEAMDAEQYTWRPMEGVRSMGEVFMHVAADNYFLPLLAGVPVPEHTGMTMDYETVLAFEGSITDRAAILAELQASFRHLRDALAAVPVERAGEEMEFFGRTTNLQGLWIDTTVHLHEHLGQSIAYARSNEVVPPWSQGN